jgi:hypothetical protein
MILGLEDEDALRESYMEPGATKTKYVNGTYSANRKLSIG